MAIMFQVLALLFGLLASPAFAQNTTCSDRGASDNSNACANTRYVTSAITASYPNVWLKSVVGTGKNAVATDFNPLYQSLWIVGTYSGSGVGPFAEISATDTANSNGSTFPNSALRIDHNINNGAGAGNRNTLLPILTKNIAISGTDATKKFYTPFFSQMYSTAGDGGSGGSPYGSYYGFSSIMQAQSGSTYLQSVAGGEIDVAVQTGASTDLKVGLLLASVNNDAVKGTSYDGFLAFGADSTTTAKWTYGITFGWPKGPWAFDTSSTLIGSVASTTSRVANYGIDFSGVTFSTGAFKSTGFLVSPSGAATVASLASTGAVSGTSGTFAGTLSSIGATAGLVAGSRSGSGNSYQWYNPSGNGIRMTDGGSDLVTIDSAGAIVSLSTIKATQHLTTAAAPATSSCGTSPAVTSDSSANGGKVTFGSGTTTCTLTFSVAFPTSAYCTITPLAQPAAVANIPYISAQSKTAFTISGGTASAAYQYTCAGN